jgi:hypothetical protein
MKTVEQIQSELWDKNHTEQKKILKRWAKQIVDECAQIADEWRSTTPEWTKGYVETVKTRL